MFEPPAVPVNMSVWNAVPMPVVLPVDAVSTPPAAVVNQLDGGAAPNMIETGLGAKRSRLCRYGCQGYPAYKGHDHSAHFSLHRECGGTVGERWLTEPVAGRPQRALPGQRLPRVNKGSSDFLAGMPGRREHSAYQWARCRSR